MERKTSMCVREIESVKGRSWRSAERRHGGLGPGGELRDPALIDLGAEPADKDVAYEKGGGQGLSVVAKAA
jgi:hypothetical protein